MAKATHKKKAPHKKRERGNFLTFILMLSLGMMFYLLYQHVNVITDLPYDLVYLVTGRISSIEFGGLFYIFVYLAEIVALYGVFSWKKAAAYALFLLYIAYVVVFLTHVLAPVLPQLYTTKSTVLRSSIILGLGELFLLYIPVIVFWFWAIRRKWKYFE
jgi:hypothetical protein